MAALSGRSTGSLAGRGHMRTLIIAVVAALTLSHAHAEVARRELVQSEVAKIGGTLFPEHCGPRGDRCGYGYISRYSPGEPRRSVCPFELWISMPETAQVVGWPNGLWVGLDERKRPIAIASHKKYGDSFCANRQQAS